MSDEYQKLVDDTLMDSEEVEEEQLDEDDESDESDSRLIYKKRIKAFIKDVCSSELPDLRVGRSGMEGLENTAKYLLATLSYEMLEILKEKRRKTISAAVVELALTRLIGTADAIGITIGHLEALIDNLENANKTIAFTKALEYVNLGHVGTVSNGD